VSIRNYYEDVRKVFVLGATLALLASGCGSTKHATTTTVRRHSNPADQSAAKFVVGVQAQLRRGQFAVAWRTLHPAERRVISQSRLASCYPANALPRTVTFRATQVRDVSWQVPGATTFSEAKEVTVKAEAGGKTVDAFKQHVVRAGQSWTWMLSAPFFSKAKRGAC
jgi:hypothetical protein